VIRERKITSARNAIAPASDNGWFLASPDLALNVEVIWRAVAWQEWFCLSRVGRSSLDD
jgi:hypothetical protein